MQDSFFVLDNLDADKPQFRYAGFWIRFLAKLIDLSILGALGWLITLLTSDSYTYRILLSVAPLLYQSYFHSSSKAGTIGKQAMGIKVIKRNGEKLNFVEAVLRSFAEFFSMFIFYLGYITAAFNNKKQTWHDKLCGTYVVYLK